MNSTGTYNPQHGAEILGLSGSGKLFWNLGEAALHERAIARAEARLTASGALAATSPSRTGAQVGRHYVEPVTGQGAEGASADGALPCAVKTLARESFDALKGDMLAHAGGRTLFVQDLHAGGGSSHRIGVRIFTEHAWQALAMRALLRRPAGKLADFVPDLTLLCAPAFKADEARHGVGETPFVACDFAEGLVLIGGAVGVSELKGAVLAYLNHYLTPRGVLPLHSAATGDVASGGAAGGVALFLGLPGAGKTALSSATLGTGRGLIGDSAHGWGPEGVFNLEGGCHVRTAGLTAQGDPALYEATRRFGTILENVALDGDTREPDYLATGHAGARAVFPLEALASAHAGGTSRAPRHLFMLACDTTGVLPAIARLTPAQAVYHFISGYGAIGMEAGEDRAEPVFSPGYGADFIAGSPATHVRLLRDLIEQGEVECWLVNTGWTGGKPGHGTGSGRRIPLAATRRLVEAALAGELTQAPGRTDPHFGFTVPFGVEGVDAKLLDPVSGWRSRIDHAMAARRLVRMFSDHFSRFEKMVDEDVRGVQPVIAMAAE